MVRKMPWCCWDPKSTWMSSVKSSVESGLIVMSEWKELMTQPSSAWAGEAASVAAQSAVRVASRSRDFIANPYIASRPP